MIDCSKLSNKGDLIAIIGTIVIGCLFGLVIYLASSDQTFAGGFLAGTITWRWKIWIFDPIDRFLEAHWPFKD